MRRINVAVDPVEMAMARNQALPKGFSEYGYDFSEGVTFFGGKYMKYSREDLETAAKEQGITVIDKKQAAKQPGRMFIVLPDGAPCPEGFCGTTIPISVWAKAWGIDLKNMGRTVHRNYPTRDLTARPIGFLETGTDLMGRKFHFSGRLVSPLSWWKENIQYLNSLHYVGRRQLEFSTSTWGADTFVYGDRDKIPYRISSKENSMNGSTHRMNLLISKDQYLEAFLTHEWFYLRKKGS